MAKRAAFNVLEAIRSQPWAITTEALETIVAIANRDTAAVQARLEAVLAQRGEPLDNAHNVELRDSVALLPVRGPLVRYASFFSDISGATAYERVATDFVAARDNPAVNAIVLLVDSPGGTVNGLHETAELIHESRGSKPIVAIASDLMASAAYVLASAADRIVTSPAGVLGSIGGVLEVTVREERPGVRTHHIVSSQSPKKRLDPASPEGQAQMQAFVDAQTAVIIDAIAKYRGITAERVVAEYGQGDVFVGNGAVTVGLADRVATTEAVIAELSAAAPKRNWRVTRSTLATSPTEEPSMSAASTTSAPATPAPVASAPATPAPTPAPAAMPAPVAAAPSTPATDLVALRTEAAAAERTRVLGIQSLARSANDEVVTACVNDPSCTVEAAALRIAQDTKAKAAARLDARAENDRALPSGAAPAATESTPGAQIVAALRLIRPEPTAAPTAAAAR